MNIATGHDTDGTACKHLSLNKSGWLLLAEDSGRVAAAVFWELLRPSADPLALHHGPRRMPERLHQLPLWIIQSSLPNVSGWFHSESYVISLPFEHKDRQR